MDVPDDVELAVEGAHERMGVTFPTEADRLPVVGCGDGDIGFEGDGLVGIGVAVDVHIIGEEGEACDGMDGGNVASRTGIVASSLCVLRQSVDAAAAE